VVCILEEKQHILMYFVLGFICVFVSSTLFLLHGASLRLWQEMQRKGGFLSPYVI